MTGRANRPPRKGTEPTSTASVDVAEENLEPRACPEVVALLLEFLDDLGHDMVTAGMALHPTAPKTGEWTVYRGKLLLDMTAATRMANDCADRRVDTDLVEQMIKMLLFWGNRTVMP